MIGTPSLLLAAVWTQAETPATDTGNGILDALLKGGPFAIVLALIIFDKLGTNSERDRLRAENKELRTQNQNLNDTIRQEVVPPLTELNRLMGETLQVLSDEQRFPAKRSTSRRT